MTVPEHSWPNSSWKGYLRLSLVTCPIRMMPATGDGEKVRFRTINRETGHPVVSRSVDAQTRAVVPSEDQVRGYARGENDYVMLDDDELEAVALESTRTIDIETFVDADKIGWIWYDRPFYILPSDPVGEEAFAVICAAMAATKRAGIARLVTGGRERAVLLLPRLDGIVLWTLRFGDEVRDATPPDFVPPDPAPPDPALLDMVCRLIDARTEDWSPQFVRDPVQESLRDLVAAKRKTRGRPAKAAKKRADHDADPNGNVISIMDALRRSLSAGRKR